MELWDQRRRRPALGRATPGVQSRASVVFAGGFATAARPSRSLDWTTAPFGAPISIASGGGAVVALGWNLRTLTKSKTGAQVLGVSVRLRGSTTR